MRGVLFDIDDTRADDSGAQPVPIVDYLACLGFDHKVAAELDDGAADAWFAGYTTHVEQAWTAYDVGAALAVVASCELAPGIVIHVDADHRQPNLEIDGPGDNFGVIVG